jgi:CRISPR-associated protein Cas2
MTVIITNDTPPAIRGLLKRWFLEPKPNVFVGTVNRRTREKTLEFIRRNAPDLGMLVIAPERNCQGYAVKCLGDTDRRDVEQCGLWLIAEKWEESADQVAEGVMDELQPM